MNVPDCPGCTFRMGLLNAYETEARGHERTIESLKQRVADLEDVPTGSKPPRVPWYRGVVRAWFATMMVLGICVASRLVGRSMPVWLAAFVGAGIAQLGLYIWVNRWKT